MDVIDSIFSLVFLERTGEVAGVYPFKEIP
jgi:hypothetical protein